MSILIDKKLWQSIGAKAGWSSSKQTKIAQAEDKILVDMGSKSVSMPSTIRRNINKALHGMGNFHRTIPLEQINSILEANNCVMIQEDGTKWAGFIAPTGYCGETNRDGSSKNAPMQFDLAMKTPDGKYTLCGNVLVMTACKMPSEKIEIVAYIS